MPAYSSPGRHTGYDASPLARNSCRQSEANTITIVITISVGAAMDARLAVL